MRRSVIPRARSWRGKGLCTSPAANEIDATIAERKRRKFVRDTQTRVVLRQIV